MQNTPITILLHTFLPKNILFPGVVLFWRKLFRELSDSKMLINMIY